MGAVIRCVGALVYDDAGRLLMVRRGQDPDRGKWSLPGGRVEPGETDEQAVRRELLEETGLPVDVGGLVGTVTLPGVHGGLAEVRDYRCRLDTGADPGEARAGDDADEVGWFSAAQLPGLDCPSHLLATLRSWQALPL